MSDNTFRVIFAVGALVYLMLIGVSRSRSRKNVVTERSESIMHSLLSILSFLGTHVIPLTYIFTPWLSFADYQLPASSGWIGVAIFAGSLVLITKAHADLGRSWSIRMEVVEGQSLVTQGIYHHIRHPIYAAMWLWGIGQMLLLHNWIAGPTALILFVPICLYRVPHEERMMLEHFGDEYHVYMKHTRRFLPKIW